jgi:hypothetical protein
MAGVCGGSVDAPVIKAAQGIGMGRARSYQSRFAVDHGHGRLYPLDNGGGAHATGDAQCGKAGGFAGPL